MKQYELQMFLAFLLIALPASATESVDTPNDRTCSAPNDCNVPSGVAGKRMKIIVNLAGGSNIPTADIPLAGGDTGELVARDSWTAVCTAAQSEGFGCAGFFLGPITACGGGGGEPDCCSPSIAVSRTVAVTCTKGTRSFDLTRTADDDRFAVAGTPTPIRGVNTNTNAGNSTLHDVLPNWVGRVEPNGVDGVVTFSVEHTQGGTNPRTHTVDTTGKSDTQLHTEICAGFVSLGLGLECKVHTPSQAANHTQNPAAFGNGAFVRVPNLQGKGVTVIGATGLEGQEIIQEQNLFGQQPVPVLSPWGIALLPLILILCIVSYMRRREQPQPG